MRTCRLVAAALMVAAGVEVEAAPAISGAVGTFQDGSDVVLNGSGFGTNTSNRVFLGGADGHIESAAVGKDLSWGTWLLSSGAVSTRDQAPYVVSDANVRTGQKAWLIDMSNAEYYNGSIRYDYGTPIPENTDIYISWWVKKDTLQNGGQWKMFRLSHINSIVDGGTEIVMFNWLNQSPQIIIRPSVDAGTSAISLWGTNYPKGDNNWYRMEFAVKTSSQTQKDGYIQQALHKPFSGTPVSAGAWAGASEPTPKFPAAQTYATADKRFRWFLWQNYRGNGISSAKFWMDDFYVQVGSLARVEIGDANTWASCTFRDIQEIKSWSNSSITINANTSALASGQTYYAYVVGADGSVSPPYAFTNSDSGSSPPEAPTLQVN